MKLTAAGILTLVVALNTPPSEPLQKGAGATCMPLDAAASAMLAGLRRLASGTAPEQQESRNWKKLPLTSASAVSHVTDNTVCSSAERVYTAALPLTTAKPPSHTVRVFKVGNVFVVHDTAQAAGDYYVAMTLSKRYTVLARYHQ